MNMDFIRIFVLLFCGAIFTKDSKGEDICFPKVCEFV